MSIPTCAFLCIPRIVIYILFILMLRLSHIGPWESERLPVPFDLPPMLSSSLNLDLPVPPLWWPQYQPFLQKALFPFSGGGYLEVRRCAHRFRVVSAPGSSPWTELETRCRYLHLRLFLYLYVSQPQVHTSTCSLGSMLQGAFWFSPSIFLPLLPRLTLITFNLLIYGSSLVRK